MTRARNITGKLRSLLGGNAEYARNEELKLAHQEIKEKQQRIRRLHQRLAQKERDVEQLPRGLDNDDAETGGVSPENIIWIIGSPRTGSTWLSRMMGELEGFGVWEEPFFGVILSFRDNIANQGWAASSNFLLGDPNKPIWLKHMRRMFLAVGRARFGDHEHLVVKEPNGSVGARLVLEAFPESKVILLVRDPRDIVASLLDAAKKGSWYGHDRYEASAATAQFEPETGSFTIPEPQSREESVERISRDVVASFAASREAFDAHGGRKVVVRYEDLRTDSVGEMKKLCSTLGVIVDEEQLTQAVEKHAWENIPTEKKGEGKALRKATPGGWKEDLSPEQAQAVERSTTAVLAEFYPE